LARRICGIHVLRRDMPMEKQHNRKKQQSASFEISGLHECNRIASERASHSLK
jgi:hypothetical protein